jgi:hypothetical protein
VDRDLVVVAGRVVPVVAATAVAVITAAAAVA